LDAWDIEIDGKSLTFGVRSSLRRSRVPDTRLLDEDYSDYELSHQLPEVAYSIIDHPE